MRELGSREATEAVGSSAGGGAAGRSGGAAGAGASVRFAQAARTVADVARGERWVVPGFRSPPRVVGAERTVRRRADGGAVVAVRVRGRPWAAVVGDLIEGVVVTNRLAGADARRCRDRLWEALLPAGEQAA